MLIYFYCKINFITISPEHSSGAGMVKLVRVEKKKLKISAKEHRESMKKNAASKKVLEEEEKQYKKHLEKMKKEKEEHAA